MRTLVMIWCLLYGEYAYAHQWTPTYPVLRQSYVDNVSVTDMLLFNGRDDINYYEISVLDDDMNPIPFATTDKIINLNYLQRKKVEVYIRNKDIGTARYICSKSKIVSSDVTTPLISSRICSKLK